MQTKYNAPSPSPFPFSHHGQASCSAACPWVRKGEGGRGWGSVFAAHTQWAAPVSCEGQQKIVHNSGIVLCQSDKHNSQTPILPKKRGKYTCHPEPKGMGGQQPPGVAYKHTEHWVCGNPKQRVLCKQKIHCPIPFPLPLFLTMGRPEAKEPAHG